MTRKRVIPLYQIIILAIIQGLTEFLPVSSGGHLIVIPRLLGWQDQGQLIDVAFHFGTLGAVILYFSKDVLSLIKGSFSLTKGKIIPGGELFLQLSLATLPSVIVGGVISYFIQDLLRQVSVIAWASIIFGLILYLVDRKAPAKFSSRSMTYSKALFVGVIQVFALIPGASRSGTCMTALRFLGFNRLETVRYSCLMSIPLIIAATALVTYKALKLQPLLLSKEVCWAIAFSFLTGLISISFMMRWVQYGSFIVFACYRVLAGIGLLILYSLTLIR